MRTLLLCLALLVAPLLAQAGHGTIEETDEGIVVEYSGDAADKAEKPAASGTTPQAAPEAGPTSLLPPPPRAAEDPGRALRIREQNRRDRARRQKGADAATEE